MSKISIRAVCVNSKHPNSLGFLDLRPVFYVEHYSQQWKSRTHKSFTCMLQKNRVKDFREAMIKYLEAMMDSQQQVCYSGVGGGGE